MTPELTYLAYSVAVFFIIVSVQGYSGIANNGGLRALQPFKGGMK